MARARAPEVVGNLGIGIAGPPIMAYGSDAQRRRFLRRILTAEDLWCFGFSEPGAGSDLASLRTTALPKDDHFEVSGQKAWTTLAQTAWASSETGDLCEGTSDKVAGYTVQKIWSNYAQGCVSHIPICDGVLVPRFEQTKKQLDDAKAELAHARDVLTKLQ